MSHKASPQPKPSPDYPAEIVPAENFMRSHLVEKEKPMQEDQQPPRKVLYRIDNVPREPSPSPARKVEFREEVEEIECRIWCPLISFRSETEAKMSEAK